MNLKMEKANIAVLGLAHVGCVTAACLASLGHRVLGIYRDLHKVREVENGRVPFYEPGLDDLVGENIPAGRLSPPQRPIEFVNRGLPCSTW
jgi:UDP-glucose 6-dehydrogenase